MIRDQGAQQMPPIEFVAMVDENTDLVPDRGEDEAGRAVAGGPAAGARSARPGETCAGKTDETGEVAGRRKRALAPAWRRWHCAEGDDAGALAVLDASQAPDLPPELMEQRLILRAGVGRTAGRSGRRRGAAGARAHRTRHGSAGPDTGERVGLGRARNRRGPIA